MLRVASIMTRKLVSIPPECSIERAHWLLQEHKVRHVLVMEHERLVGILSERDVMERPESSPRVRPRFEAGSAAEARDRMSISLETVSPDEPVLKACRRLLDRRIGCLPVVQDGRVAGVVSELDLLRLYVHACRFEGRASAGDPPVEKVMSREVVIVSPDQRVSQALELCRSKGIRHLPVVYDGWLVGIVSDRDLLPVVGRAEGDLRDVKEVMTKDYVASLPETPLSEAAAAMLRSRFRSLPVVAGGALKGIVTSTDVLQVLCALDEQILESAWSGEQALSANRQEE